MRKVVLQLVCAFTFIPQLSVARWASFQDAAFAVNFESAHTKIKRNGAYTNLYERQVEILKESARTDMGLVRITYNENSGGVKIIKAKTIKQRYRIGKLTEKLSVLLKRLLPASVFESILNAHYKI